MKKLFLLIGLMISFFLFITIAKGQSYQNKSNFAVGFEQGFKEGYCYNSKKIYCDPGITPLVPIPRINENERNYQDGYNRGFQVGLDLQRLTNDGEMITGQNIPLPPIPNLRFNDYVPQNPVEAMRRVGLYKETLFRLRVQWVQNRIDGLYDLAFSILSDDGYNMIAQAIVNLGNDLKSRKDLGDFANDRVMAVISQALRKIEKTIYEEYKLETQP